MFNSCLEKAWKKSMLLQVNYVQEHFLNSSKANRLSSVLQVEEDSVIKIWSSHLLNNTMDCLLSFQVVNIVNRLGNIFQDLSSNQRKWAEITQMGGGGNWWNSLYEEKASKEHSLAV